MPDPDPLSPLIRLRGVSRRFRSGDRDLVVLDGVDLDVRAGETVAIVGPSGSGKSTLLALIAGLDRPSAGTVEVDGEPVHELDEDRLALLRRRIGFVFQSFRLLPHLTARENVALPLEIRATNGSLAAADALLSEVGLRERAHHYPAQLSGGEQQRVALARAFAASPALLLADEPTGSLDRGTGAAVLDRLAELRREHGAALVLVTHDPEAAALADRRFRLERGKLEPDS